MTCFLFSLLRFTKCTDKNLRSFLICICIRWGKRHCSVHVPRYRNSKVAKFCFYTVLFSRVLSSPCSLFIHSYLSTKSHHLLLPKYKAIGMCLWYTMPRTKAHASSWHAGWDPKHASAHTTRKINPVISHPTPHFIPLCSRVPPNLLGLGDGDGAAARGRCTGRST